MTEAAWAPSQRYPDPSIVALDPSFKRYHLALSAVERLWTGLTRAAPVEATRGWHPRIEKVFGMLNDPLAPQSLRELAAAAGLSPYHLSVLFRQQTGMSLPAYRNQLRLNRFFALYREHPEMDLLTLALDAGFGSYAQFYRVFRSFMGRTPGRWTHAVKP